MATFASQEQLREALSFALENVVVPEGFFADLMVLIDRHLVESHASVIQSMLPDMTRAGREKLGVGKVASAKEEIPPMSTNAKINGFICDPATAERVFERPGGDDTLDAGHVVRLSTVLFRAPEGHWFTIRALTPEEAEEWLCRAGDEVLARHLFPDAAKRSF